MQGGVATYLQVLLNDKNQEYENYLLLSYEKSNHEWPLQDNHIIYYHYNRSWKFILPTILYIQKVIAEINPEIIYVHSTWAGVMVRLPYVFQKRKAKIIYNAHGWSFLMDTGSYKKKLYELVERILAQKTDRIINVSKYEYELAVKRHIPANKQTIIYSGISPLLHPIRNDNILPDDKFNLLFVGRFDSQKGVDYLLEAFEACDRKDIHLTLVGENVLSESININAINTDKLTFCGWVSHDKLGDYYQQCDAVVMPSRWEAFGLVAIEAMKYGRPVIVSNRGALPELVINDVNGYVFNMDDKSTLIDILMNINRDKCQRMRKNVSRIFQEKYKAERMLKEIYELYNMVLEK